MLFLVDGKRAGSCTFVVNNFRCEIWKELVVLLISACEGTEF